MASVVYCVSVYYKAAMLVCCFTSYQHLRVGTDFLYLYSATPLGDQATCIMTQYVTQPYYPDTERTSFCHILLMQCIRLVSNKF